VPTVEERVARGVEWLDANEPGWERRIKLDALILSSSCRCILGQIYGSFHRRPDELEEADEFGFTVLVVEDYSAFEPLAVEWRRVITSRREAAEHAGEALDILLTHEALEHVEDDDLAEFWELREAECSQIRVPREWAE
jgi:hypothetical protein